MKSKNPHSGFHEEQIARTLDTKPDPTCNQGGNVVVEPVYALQGNGIDRSDTAGCNGSGWRTDEMYTLNTIDRPAVAFQQNQREEVRDMGERTGALTAQPGIHNQNFVCYPDIARTLTERYDSSPCIDRGQNVICYGVDCRNGTLDEEKTHTLQAKANGGISLNCTPSVMYETGGSEDMMQDATCFRKSVKPRSSDDSEKWIEDDVTNTLNNFENTDIRTSEAIVYRNGGFGEMVEGVGTLRANGGDAGGELKASSLRVYDARGNGDGKTVPTLTGDHQNRVTDYTSIIVETNDEWN